MAKPFRRSIYRSIVIRLVAAASSSRTLGFFFCGSTGNSLVDELGDGLGPVRERGSRRPGSASADPIYACGGSERLSRGSAALLGD